MKGALGAREEGLEGENPEGATLRSVTLFIEPTRSRTLVI
jgi:hypothetical protein